MLKFQNSCDVWVEITILSNGKNMFGLELTPMHVECLIIRGLLVDVENNARLSYVLWFSMTYSSQLSNKFGDSSHWSILVGVSHQMALAPNDSSQLYSCGGYITLD